jgi:myo-inositol-1(or 4)-monophosphatase
MTMAFPDPHQLLALATRLATEASALVIAGRQHLEVSTKSSVTDMVTQMDKASEAFIVDAITAVRSDDGILAEEGSSRPGSTGVQWLIDPIDGTTNYLYGAHGFAISIAAQYDGETVLAVVHDCILGEQFTAIAGEGARLDGSPIACSSVTELPLALIATGFSYQPARRVRQAEVVARMIDQVRDIRRRGSAALDLCWVACGRADAYFEIGLGPWDIAAGDLIAREAGVLTAPFREGLADISVVAAPPALFEGLHALLGRVGAADT